MALIVRFDSKKQLIGALDRNEVVRGIASKPDEVSGYLHELLTSVATVAVTNKNNTFYATVKLDKHGKVKVIG